MTPEKLRECQIDQCSENTDREIYRGPDEGCGDYYSDSLHITQEGALGIACGGYVIVKPIRTWHGLSKAHAAALEEVERLKIAEQIILASIPEEYLADTVAGSAQNYIAHLEGRAEKAERRAEHLAEKCEAAWKAGDELTMQRMQAYRKAERLKGHAEAMYTGIKHDVKFCLLRPNEWAEKAADAYRAEFKEE